MGDHFNQEFIRVLKNNPVQVRNFHVVGGGCFGTQYVSWLLRAQKLGMVDFEKIYAVDRNPRCQLIRQGPEDPALEILEGEWTDYFTEFLANQFRSSQAERDHWVPAPLSPHILFLGFLRAAETFLQREPFHLLPFQEDVGTPVQIPLQNGTLATSFAEWQCPVNCIEPNNCPAVHSERTWDMKKALQKYFHDQAAYRSAHVLQCRHLVHGVGTIPFQAIFTEFKKMLENLKREETTEVTVATVSGCHGLIGNAGMGS